MSHLLPDMIDKSLPSVISAKLLFRRAAAPSSTSSYSSSNHRSTATCLFVHRCIRGVAGLPRSIFSKELFNRCRVVFLPNKKPQADVIVKMFHTAKKKISACLNLRIIIWNFLPEAMMKFLCREFTVIFGLNSLAILLSGVDRAKGKLGWKLRLAARFERLVMSK